MPATPTTRVGFSQGYTLGENNWNTGMDENWKAADRVIPSDFGVAAVSGLVLSMLGGVIDDGTGTFSTVTGTTITVATSTLSYIQRNAAGVISQNTTGFSATAYALYKVSADATSITVVTDHRYPQGQGRAWASALVAAMTLDMLADVVITAPADGDALVYSTAAGHWVNGAGGAGVASLPDLTDVDDALSPSDGDVLTYNATATLWQTSPALANPMTAVGDIIVGGASGAATRLAAGADGRVLTLVAGTPSWEAPAGSTNNTRIDKTQGRVIVGGAALTAIDANVTISMGTQSKPARATTNCRTSFRRINCLSTAATNTVGRITAGVSDNQDCVWRDTNAGGGGFTFAAVLGFAATASGHYFACGVHATGNLQLQAGVLASVVNAVVVGFDQTAAIGNLKVFRNDGAGVCTEIDTGIAVNTTSMYRIVIACASGTAAAMSVTVTDLATGTEYSSGSLTSEIPAAGVNLFWGCVFSTGLSSTAVSLDVANIKMEYGGY